MGKALSIAILFLFALTQISCAAKTQDPVQTFLNGCETELDTYCSTVEPGEGRLLACLYAHNDKISGHCEYAVYDAAAQLERVVASLAYVANECRDDLEAFCANVTVGEGRVIECLEKNEAKLSQRCNQAIKDVVE